MGCVRKLKSTRNNRQIVYSVILTLPCRQETFENISVQCSLRLNDRRPAPL